MNAVKFIKKSELENYEVGRFLRRVERKNKEFGCDDYVELWDCEENEYFQERYLCSSHYMIICYCFNGYSDYQILNTLNIVEACKDFNVMAESLKNSSY